MVSQAVFDFIAPLLREQSYIDAVHYVLATGIPRVALDCDAPRGSVINLIAGNIKDYFYKFFAVLADPPCRWIEPASASDQYDIGRSTRYLNQAINYGLLAQLGLRIGFVWLPREFAEFHARFPDLPVNHVSTRDTCDVCNAIASASLYIGNQISLFRHRRGIAGEPAARSLRAGAECRAVRRALRPVFVDVRNGRAGRHILLARCRLS